MHIAVQKKRFAALKASPEHGGPVECVDPCIDAHTKIVLLTANMGYRRPVRMLKKPPRVD